MIQNIKPGYQLHITTWENDADNYKTQIFSGLTIHDVRFYLDIITKFKSKNGLKAKGLGNTYNSVEVLGEVAKKALLNNPETSQEIKDTWWSYLTAPTEDMASAKDDVVCEDIIELYTDLLGQPDEFYYNEYGFCRVMESFNIYYIPSEIEDVTAKFIDSISPN